LKIAVYHPWIYLRGGIERVFVELAKRSRHELTFFTSHYEPRNTFPEFAKMRVVDVGGVSVRRSFLDLSSVAKRISGQKLDLQGFDCLVASTAGFGEFIVFRNSGLPIVGYVHTPLRVIHDPEYRRAFLARSPIVSIKALGREFGSDLNFAIQPLVANLLFPISARAYVGREREAWKRFAAVITNSEEVKRRIVGTGLLPKGMGITVLYPGIDLAKMKPGRAYDKYFLAPGRIMWSKNFELAIAAFRESGLASRGFRLVVAGAVDEKSGPYLAKLKALAAGLPVDFVENPSDARLASLYSKCTCVLFPAVNEDWGIVPVEGMAYAKPVISADEGGPRESIADGKTGFLVRPDARSFAQKMALLAGSPALVRRMGAAGRKRAALFTWDECVKRFDAAIDAAVQRSRSSL